MKQIKTLAYDPGAGNDKLSSQPDQAHALQSVVVRPRKIGQAALGANLAARATSVIFQGGETFMVGPGAWAWGTPITSYDFSDLATPRRLALFYASFAAVHAPGDYEIGRLVIGLPVPLLQDSAMAELTQEQIGSSYKCEHVFSVDDDLYRLNIRRATAVSQPLGAYANWALDEHGNKRMGLYKKLVGVLDIGTNTVDFIGVQNFRIDPRWVGGGKVGVRTLLQTLGSHTDIEQLDDQLRRGTLDLDGRSDSWLGSVLGLNEQTWGDKLGIFDLIIPVGGGVILPGENLRRALSARGATVRWPQHPVLENVLGLYKLGLRLG